MLREGGMKMEEKKKKKNVVEGRNVMKLKVKGEVDQKNLRMIQERFRLKRKRYKRKIKREGSNRKDKSDEEFKE